MKSVRENGGFLSAGCLQVTCAQLMELKESLMIRIITTLLVCCFSLLASAKDLEMKVSLSKSTPSSNWVITYNFSEAIDAISFEKTPYSFIKSDWIVQTTSASLDLSSLHVEFSSPGRSLSIALRSNNDDFIRGFYTPFLNFSDGSSAIYLGHYLPEKIKVSGFWKAIEEVTMALTISPSATDSVFFDEKNSVDKLPISADDAAQYAYVGRLPPKSFDGFTVILDPQLPKWISDSFLKAVPEFFSYYEARTRAKLDFSPLFIVNFQAGAGIPRFDGGAINRQVAINFVGDGWKQDPDANLINVLLLLAHEMAHLWNSQHWRPLKNNPLWMHEGSADYFARKAILNFGYVSAEEDASYYRARAEKCIAALEGGALHKLKNRADHYICGEVVFKLAALMTKSGSHLDVWNQLVVKEGSAFYSEDDFIHTLAKKSVDKDEARTIERALRYSSDDRFHALIDKYIGRSSNDSVPP